MKRIALRIEYGKETGKLFSDSVPAYADWLEKKLAKEREDNEHQEDINNLLKLAHERCELAYRMQERSAKDSNSWYGFMGKTLAWERVIDALLLLYKVKPPTGKN